MAESTSTPTTSHGVTGSWLEAVLTQHEDRSNTGSSVVVNTFKVNPGVAAGENFQSELAKIEVEATMKRKDQADDVTKTYNLVAKFLHGRYTDRSYMVMMGGPLRELMIYRDIVPRLNQFQAEVGGDGFQLQVPGFIHGVCGGPLEYVLVLEDVRPSGYANNDKFQGLGLNQMLMAVERLAWLHAVSFAFDKKHNFKESFPASTKSSEQSEFDGLFMAFTIDMFIDFLNKVGKSDLKNKIKKNNVAIKNKMQSLMVQLSDGPIKVLCHGDYWNNNMMFKAKEGGAEGLSDPDAVVLLDWGNTEWGQSPARDVNYLLYTSTTLEFRQNHKEEVLRHYHSTFTAAAASLGEPVPSFTYEAFQEELRKFSLIGVTCGFIVSLFTLSTFSKEYTKTFHTTKPRTSGFGLWFEKVTVKIMMPLLTNFNSVLFGVWRNMFRSFTKPLGTGKDPILDARITDLLTEADENGLFEV